MQVLKVITSVVWYVVFSYACVPGNRTAAYKLN